MRHLIIAICASALASTAAAQEGRHEHSGPPPQRLGRVSFPTSCRPAAQPVFERGVALLHSFWYEEASVSFRKSVEADSNCALGYWGVAMSALHPLWTPPGAAEARDASAAAERAVELTHPGSRERDYAEAIAAYYRHYATADHKTGLFAYERAMAGVAQRHPKDNEARIFHALALIGNGQNDGDTSFARQRRAGGILEPLFVRRPDHPGLAHYLIHAYDSPALASRGVKAAGRYAAIAPSVPHAQHMPSHIYVRIGRWDAVIASNLRAAESGRLFEESKGTTALWDQRGHALDYLMYAYLQQGREAEARALAVQAAAVTAVFPKNTLTNDYALAAIPARYALERNDWAAAETLTIRPAPAWRGAEAVTHFARALGGAHRKNISLARAEVDTLGQLDAALAQAGGAQAYWSGQARIQRLAASAWLAWAEGDTAGALKLGAEAADLEDITEKSPVTPGSVLPARELFGDLLLELGHPAKARLAYEASLARQPLRARSLAGLAAARKALRTSNR
ncbi:MAG: hypothetical protein H0T50_08915 [Gemmatimonadales bacterium]|nr:hypothetical protein [Gemmatimonadales bacterium]